MKKNPLSWYSLPQSRAIFLISRPLVCWAGVAILTGGAHGQSNGAGQPIPVAASFSVLADVVRQVGGDQVAVQSLVPVEGDSHTFEPTPALAAELKEAKLVFEIGAGFEPWLNRIYEASGCKGKRIVVSQGIDLIAVRDESGSGSHAHEHHGHDHGGYDPHIWSDPNNVIKITETICSALSEVDSVQAPLYRQRAGEYRKRLEELDRWIREQVAVIPKERRTLVTNHDTLAYFARRYGFKALGSVLSATTTEAHDPSAAEFAALAKKIREHGVPAIFAEHGENENLVRKLAAEAGVPAAAPLYPDALTGPSGPAPNYEAMMRYNVSTIVEALR